MKISIIFFLFINLALSKNKESFSDKMIEIKNVMNKKNNQILLLNGKISSVKNKLRVQNSQYLDFVENIEKLQNEINDLNGELSERELKFESLRQDILQSFQYYVASSKDAQDDDELLLQAALVKSLKEKSFEVEKEYKSFKSMQKQLVVFNNALAQLKKKEESLLSFIKDLEGSKQQLQKNALAETKEAESLTREYNLLKIEKRELLLLKRKNSSRYLSRIFKQVPLQNISEIYKKNKGINFIYNKSQYLEAPAEGKVVYAGSLGAFGNIIMIEHKANIRSVMLGKLQVTKEVGNLVKAGDQIAILNYDELLKNELYFEIRKNNEKIDALKALKHLKL